MDSRFESLVNVYRPTDIRAIALVKGDERYVFLFDEANRAETLRTLGKFAANPELSFTWYDAAKLSQSIRNEKFDRIISRKP